MPIGTDFLTFATGSGSNIEDQPSYLSDPLRQSGNLPGIARSNFNNKALRQGTFVACAISTFITQQLNVFVVDDGDVQKYVDYFRQALSALFTGLLPDDPDLSLYVRKSGDTMTGDLQFVPGASIQLSNQTWLRGKNTAGTPLNILIMASDNNIWFSDGSTAYTFFGNTPVVTNGRYWTCRDAGGTPRPVLGMDGSNNTFIYAIGPLFINSGNAWFNSSIIIPNSAWYYSKLTNGSPYNIMTVDGANRTLIQSPNDMHISTPGDRWIYLNSGNVVISNQLQAPYLRSTGSGQIDGNLIILGALQVNGGSNFYARLNVNYSAGATITGQLDSHTLHSWGNVHADSTLYCWDSRAGGSIFVGGLQVFNSGGWFYVVNGVHCDTLYSRNNIACPGSINGNGIYGNYVSSNGNFWAAGTYTGGACAVGYVESYGDMRAAGSLWLAGLQFVNSSGYWHTPNGIAVDSTSWIRGGVRAEGHMDHFNGDTIKWQYASYWHQSAVCPLSHGDGQVGAGDRAWGWIAAFNINTVSDRRDKIDMAPVPTGCLDLVRSIVPQSYRLQIEEPTTYDTSTFPGPSVPPGYKGRVVQSENPELNRMLKESKESMNVDRELLRTSRHWGFIAQDVGRVMEEAGIEFGGRSISQSGKESLSIMDMVAVLWAAVRELSDEVKTLKSA